VSGALNLADKTAVASGVTSPASVVLDSLGNIYVADGSALNINETTASASIQFGTLTADPLGTPPPPGSSTTQTATLLNYGNAPLAVTGYGNTADFSETADTCSGNSIAINSTCTVTITFSAGIGDGGTLTGEVLVQGNVANTPVGVNGTGKAPPLAGTATAMTVSANGTIEGVPVTVTVAPNPANSQPLTGTVTLTVIPGSNVPATDPPLPDPYTITAPVVNGAVQFNPPAPIGTYTFTAEYNGDTTYIYGHSSATAPVTVSTAVPVVMTQLATSSITLLTYSLPCTAGTGSTCTTSYSYGQPSGNPSPGYLIIGGACVGCYNALPYDGSFDQWQYSYPVTVAPAAAGFPMVGLAVYSTPAPPAKPVETGFNYGAVNFEDANGSSLCGNESGSSSIVNVAGNGTASFATNCAGVSNTNTTIPNLMTFHTMTPVYTGTYNDLTDVNPNYTQVKGSTIGIWAVAHPAIQISSSPASLSVAPGSSVSATLTLSSVLGYGYVGRNSNGGPDNNWSLPVDLQCQGLPAYATCTFTYPTPNPADPNVLPNPVSGVSNIGTLECASSTAAAPSYCAIDIGPAPGAVYGYGYYHSNSSTAPCTAIDGCLGPGTVTVTIATNVSSSASATLNTGKSSLALAILFGLGFLGIAFRRRATRWTGLLMLVCLLLCGGAIASITACSTTTLGTTSGSVTPAGSYWVTISAKQTGTLWIYANPGKSSATTSVVQANGNDASLPFTVNVTVN
jgi:hypothetical protein